MRFFKNGKLKDKEIESALREAANDYANGEIWEVKETLEAIIRAVEEWVEYEYWEER